MTGSTTRTPPVTALHDVVGDPALRSAEATVPSGAPPVGARFWNATARTWKADDGRTGTHATVTLCEITERDATGCRYVVVEVLEDTDPPPRDPFVASSGAFAWFGLAAAMERGDVVPA